MLHFTWAALNRNPRLNHTVISKCQSYRYTLWREINGGSGDNLLFICLNPSVADATMDDPTVRRCMSYAASWGFSGMFMCNLFAYRATNPENMKKQSDPIGPDNNKWIKETARKCQKIVLAWGNHGGHIDRNTRVAELLSTETLWCFGMTKSGQPKHPLYLKKTAPLVPFDKANNATVPNL